jgi:hypothetical protein
VGARHLLRVRLAGVQPSCDVLNQWWRYLDEEIPDFQFVLSDKAEDEVVAEGHTGPLRWDGVDETLPGGIDEAIEQIFAVVRAHKPVNTLCALAAESPREGRARGLAVQILEAMRAIAERQGLKHMVAPVRPSFKERYPMTDIERYIRWRREDDSCSTPGCASTNGLAREWPPRSQVLADHRFRRRMGRLDPDRIC